MLVKGQRVQVLDVPSCRGLIGTVVCDDDVPSPEYLSVGVQIPNRGLLWFRRRELVVLQSVHAYVRSYRA